MTADERRRVEWIAERVMGWKPAQVTGWWRDGRVIHKLWNPLVSISDAMDALEAWCEADDERTWKMVRLDDRAGYRVWLRPLIADQVADTLQAAIVAALCAASGYEEEQDDAT